jgi:hypothetical protein
MKKILFLLFLSTTIFAQINFDDYFLPKTLRLDYYHFGNADTEQIAFDQLIEELIWGGSKVNLIDTLGLGNYFFKIFDTKDNKLIYSRGYSTLFQEWQTTAEAK